jgi:lipase
VAEKRPPPARAVTPLHVHEWGEPSGSPVVCLHGLTGDGGRFRRLARGLDGRRVIAPDLRGHGSSEREPPWDTATHAADVLETVAELDVERADWVGFSFGGRIAAAVAAGAPEAVDRLCLLDPALQLPAREALERALEEFEDVGFASVDEAVQAELDSGVLFHAPRELLEEFVPETLERRPDGRLAPNHSRPMAVAAWSEMARPAPSPARVPTLLLRAESSWLPVDVDRYRVALRELLTEEVVPGGHSVLWDALGETTAAVTAFLGRRVSS